MSVANPTPRGGRIGRVLLRVGITAGVVLVIALLALGAFLIVGNRREARALEAVHASGQPLHPSEIVFPLSAGESECEARMERFCAARDKSCELGFSDREDRDVLLAEIRAWPEGASAVPLVEELFACLAGDERSSRELDRAIDAALEDPARARSLSACERRYLCARAAVSEPLVALAADVCRSAPESGERWTRELVPSDGPWPNKRYTVLFTAVRILVRTAPCLALEGRHTESVERLALAFRGANRIRGLPWQLGHAAWRVAMWWATCGVQQTLSLLPAGMDLGAIEREIDPTAPTLTLERALVGERAFGNEIFDQLRDGRLAGGTGEGAITPDGLPGAFVWTVFSYDRVFYLREMAQGILQARQPYADAQQHRRPWESHAEQFPRWAFMSAMILPRFDQELENTAWATARLSLARAALAAYRGGPAAGIHMAAEQTDPFRARPLHSRIDPNGTLVLWSVGPDLQDDGAPASDWIDPKTGELPDEPPDIVWRVLPP